MPCFNPLQGWRSKVANSSGRRGIVFNKNHGFKDLPVELPCGQCMGCRLEKSRQWAVRCVHEASMYDNNCFITLTYSNENLPADGSLHKKHFQDFMKRLRKKYPTQPPGIRFFHCGEYGEQFNRPHYHACLFNFDFNDKELFAIRDDNRLYVSEALSSLWPFGYCVIGDVTFESAAYVARYITKKVTGEKAADHYGDLQPEYATMSRRPGIGKYWYDKFKSDLFPHDKVIVRGKECTIPDYYYSLLEKDDEMLNKKLKAIRKKLATEKDDNTISRLRTKEKVLMSRIKTLTRSLEV